MEKQTLGDWCKWLEKNFSPDIMIPTLPVIIRLDGNNFHNWTKGLERPFDTGMSDLMISTTKFLVEETNAVIGYTQSDEITLILYSADKGKSIYNDGKKQKILSKLTGKTVAFFNEKRKEFLPNHNKTANFDCRIYQVPSLEDAVAQLIWRENDAVKNSIYSLARSMFSHKSLQGLNGREMYNMMSVERGINWNEIESRFKRGTYIKRSRVSKPFSAEEIESLPPKHKARKNPDLVVERNIIEEVDFPILTRITNRVGVIFYNEDPIVLSDLPAKYQGLEYKQLNEIW